ncbi:(deoxy)nucleoside triphosphate pyrophosphohydrolase [Erythrobacter sp. SCSIO 43205]|uniref:NUDIX domain-containing protein n=1 Tax=Erythrobacter sp. SCSIO 43205 TaxID=2779361 RepID=UPI001CA81163|nr:(deoxy)nucleoside triphosphate pyrophosphohydrolase [Erythrobacter sp. SCSIO 43205]UAB76913.1 (deoxy)nucleoside triphosphate pyrophosphohydrolase [Erythrobacter sp. SCSIO 43205]
MTMEVIYVVAGALRRGDELWLMHRRPQEKAHGGLWEFPGGKVERTEIPVEALIRELHEELGIVVETTACEPAAFAEDRGQSGERPLVILLYTIADWVGEPLALEGGAVDWFSSQEIAKLDKPPLDNRLCEQLFGLASGQKAG